MRRSSLLGAVLFAGAGVLGAQEQAPPPPAPAAPAATAPHAANMSVAFRFGTPGFGLEVSRLLASHVAVRVGGSLFSASTTKSETNVDYAASLKLHDFAVLFDLSPGGRGSFHLTAGLMTNPLTITATGQPTGGNYTINGKTYMSSQVGTLTAEGKFPGVNPYFGLGFGTPATEGHAVKLLFDLGVAVGKPKITMTSSRAASDSTLNADLQAQQQQTQSDVRKYLKVFPVLAFGLAYRF